MSLRLITRTEWTNGGFIWIHIGSQRRLVHQASHRIMGEQQAVKLLANQLGGLATEHDFPSSQVRFQLVQRCLDLPPLMVESRQVFGRCLVGRAAPSGLKPTSHRKRDPVLGRPSSGGIACLSGPKARARASREPPTPRIDKNCHADYPKLGVTCNDDTEYFPSREPQGLCRDQVSSGGFSTVSEYIRSLIRDAQERRARGVLEAKLLAALEKEPEEMLHDDWEQLRDRVRQLSGKTSRP